MNQQGKRNSASARIAAGLAGIAILCATNASSAAASKTNSWTPGNVRYTIADLGPLTEVAGDLAPTTNNAGQIAFWRMRPDRSIHAALLSGGDERDLGALPGFGSSISRAINRRGAVAGWSVSSQNLVDSLATTHAFVNDEGRMVDLGTLGGRDSQALGINDRGDIVGVSSIRSGEPAGGIGAFGNELHAFLYHDGKMTDLGTLPSGSYSVANAINDRGTIAGTAGYGRISVHAVIWRKGAITDLGTLPGGVNSHCASINNRGDVVGYSDIGHEEMHAFVYSNGKMRDLGSLGQAPTCADAIDDRGRIVGTSAGADGIRRAFLWQNGTMTDLNGLIAPGNPWKLEEAYAINSQDRIVCTGMKTDLKRHLLLLIPTGN